MAKPVASARVWVTCTELSFRTQIGFFCSGHPFKTAPRDQHPPTANRQPLPTATNHQLPIANRYQLSTANCRQPLTFEVEKVPDHAPVNFRFCWRDGPFFSPPPPPEGQPCTCTGNMRVCAWQRQSFPAPRCDRFTVDALRRGTVSAVQVCLALLQDTEGLSRALGIHVLKPPTLEQFKSELQANISWFITQAGAMRADHGGRAALGRPYTTGRGGRRGALEGGGGVSGRPAYAQPLSP